MVEQYNFSNANPTIDANLFNMLTHAFSIFPAALNLFIFGLAITMWVMTRKNSIAAVFTTLFGYMVFGYLFGIDLFNSITQITVASANLLFVIFTVVSDIVQ